MAINHLYTGMILQVVGPKVLFTGKPWNARYIWSKASFFGDVRSVFRGAVRGLPTGLLVGGCFFPSGKKGCASRIGSSTEINIALAIWGSPKPPRVIRNTQTTKPNPPLIVTWWKGWNKRSLKPPPPPSIWKEVRIFSGRRLNQGGYVRMQLLGSWKQCRGVPKETGGCFLKWWYPQIIHFKKVFHDFHHPFWGTLIFGNTQVKKIKPPSFIPLFHRRFERQNSGPSPTLGDETRKQNKNDDWQMFTESHRNCFLFNSSNSSHVYPAMPDLCANICLKTSCIFIWLRKLCHHLEVTKLFRLYRQKLWSLRRTDTKFPRTQIREWKKDSRLILVWSPELMFFLIIRNSSLFFINHQDIVKVCQGMSKGV